MNGKQEMEFLGTSGRFLKKLTVEGPSGNSHYFYTVTLRYVLIIT